MSVWRKWCARLSAIVGAVVLALFVPAMAWAASGPGELAVEAARRRSRGGGFLSGICCLLVVGIIVLVVMLLMRRRSGRR